jgi:hypothetical protein
VHTNTINYHYYERHTKALSTFPYYVVRVSKFRVQDGKEVVISYSSRHLNAAERNYSAIEREALAIVYGIKKYHHYLQDNKFEIISDHRPLQWLETHKDEERS